MGAKIRPFFVFASRQITAIDRELSTAERAIPVCVVCACRTTSATRREDLHLPLACFKRTREIECRCLCRVCCLHPSNFSAKSRRV